MIRTFALLALFLPAAAAAHPGHVAEVAGHGHWVAAGAIAIALGLAAWAGLSGRKTREDAPEAEAEGDEAEA
jgi:hypothetical protein